MFVFYLYLPCSEPGIYHNLDMYNTVVNVSHLDNPVAVKPHRKDNPDGLRLSYSTIDGSDVGIPCDVVFPSVFYAAVLKVSAEHRDSVTESDSCVSSRA